MHAQVHAESTLLPLLQYLGWSFLPNFATSTLQSIYYRITIPAGTAAPQPGTHQYARDHRRIRVLVLSLYLLYTLAQSLYDIKLAGDFYTLLSLNPYTTTDREIKSRLRRLAARYHPDKISPNNDHENNESIFMSLRLASETLTIPSHKYAYTHFGPNILTHLPRPDESTSTAATSRASTLQTADLVILALRQKLPSYVLTLLWVMVLNTFFLPRKSAGKFWRYFIITSSFALEFYLLTHEIPALPGFLDTSLHYLRVYTKLGDILPPHLLPFQILDITGRLAMSLNIFISQVSVLFQSPEGIETKNGMVSGEAVRGWMAQLSNNLAMLGSSAQRLDQEAHGLLELQFVPYKGEPGHVRELRRGMKEGMVTSGVRAHPEVQEAVKRVLERRKHGTSALRDGAEVVDLLDSSEQFI